ncbi:MAG: hypothetical protein E7588_04665 [Ruminococcaceae bacterium]|nr:hypothetical protein [Oscillospiraceae bacterium]
MNDIKNITDRIISDAKAYADEVINSAKAQAEEILDEYKKKSDKLVTSEHLKAQHTAADMVSRTESAQKMLERNALLNAKCEIIDEVFERALKELTQLSAEKYTVLLTSIFEKADISESCVICMNQKDLGTVGNSFLEKAKEIMLGKYADSSVILSDVPAKISGGFIVKSGNIEYNCSLENCLADFRKSHENDILKLLFN